MSYTYPVSEGEMAMSFVMEYGFSTLLSLVGYIFLSLGIYTIAKRRGITNPWLAWIPFGQSWMLGCVSDQYQHVAQGKQKSRRKALLWLDILTNVLAAVVLFSLVNAFLSIFRMEELVQMFLYGEEYLTYYEYNFINDTQAYTLLNEMMGIMGLSFVLLGVGIAAAVIKYMSLYDLYRSCNPDNATAFTVLSIFLGSILMGILVFASREKDLGMQPPQPAYGQAGYLPSQGWQNPQDPWQQPSQGWQQPPQGWQQPPQGWQQPQQDPQDPWQNNNRPW